MKTRPLGPFAVAEIGLGCMNLSHAYGAPPAPEVAERVLLEALERGVTLFDTAALYGVGANERLVGRVLRARLSRRLADRAGHRLVLRAARQRFVPRLRRHGHVVLQQRLCRRAGAR